MPSYYNPYTYMPNFYNSYAPQPVAPVQPSFGNVNPSPNYMISVDGEMAARAWQPQTQLAPNSVIPLWDLDGQHVYFKSTDAYGRMNPIRKGRVVFDDEAQTLPEGKNEPQEKVNVSGAGGFVTKEDLNDFRNEIRNMLKTLNPSPAVGNNQNGRKTSGEQYSANNRGDSR